MIIVKLAGGLGNQLFQYAMGRRLALRHGAELVLDASSLGTAISGATPRRYELAPFAINARLASPDEIASLGGSPSGGRFTSIVRRLAGMPEAGCHVFREADPCAFYVEALRLPDNVYLEGYWQAEGYFADIAEVVRREFSVVPAMEADDRAVAELIGRADAVAVHFRRGDYAHDEVTAKYHGIPPLAYYRLALAALLPQLANPELFIFSDDPEWVQANVSFPVRSHIVDHNSAAEGYKDLRLISLCRHAVIANSTFSWWGAWLISNPGKRIFAPRRWYARPGMSNPAILPAEWEAVDWS